MQRIALYRVRLSAWAMLFVAVSLAASGCRSPYHADRGALLGGLTGAGVGALVGDASGNAGAGAVIGSAVGALSGAAIGQSLDDIEARNRAMIEQELGRKVASQATVDDVIAMSRAGLGDDVIITHIQHNGVAGPINADALIFLKEQRVSDRVLNAMQQPPPRPVTVRQPAPTPVIVEEYHYGPVHPWHGYHHRRRHYGPHSGVHWGFSFRG